MYLPRVLLIVDSFDIASLDFRQLLDTAGYSTELIAYNQVTLEHINRIQPNVVFFHNSKHELPDNGIIELFQNEQLSEIPVVALAASKEIANLLLPIATVVLLLPVSEQRLINLFSLLGSIDKSVEKYPWDTLTGFYTPSFFRTRLQKALEHSRQLENGRFILYTINLKHLNRNGNGNGTEYHQRILQGVAKVLQKALRPTDIVSRFDVYQFLVLIDDVVDRFTPATIAGRMYLEFEDYLVETKLHDQIKIDIGIIYCDSEYRNADEILSDAQMALQMARQDSYSSYKVFVRNRPKSRRVSIQQHVSV